MVLRVACVQKILCEMVACKKKYGEEKLLDCLERNEKNGIY